MRVSEIGEDGATCSLPGERTKNKRPHVVPVPPLARDIIASVPRIESAIGYLFTTTGKSPVSGWSRVKRLLDAAMTEIGAAPVLSWRLHDLRRTMVTSMVDLGVAPHVVEAAVNHVSGARAGVAGVYKRSQLLPERKAALERWGSRVQTIVSGRPANVVSLSQRVRIK